MNAHVPRGLYALLCAAVVFLGACAKPADSTRATLRISQRNEPGDVDPATAALPDEFFIIRALGQGLLVPDPAGGAPLPGAADHFDVSPDGRVYTFHLRPGAVWSNGDPVIAADFVAAYRRVLTPATAAPKAELFFAVKNARAFATGAVDDFSAVGFRASDDRTLVVTLDEPDPAFPLHVASGPWIPTHAATVARFGRQWTQPANYVGNGPFTLAEWRPQQRIVVVKNPRYQASDRVRLDAIEFIRFDNEDSEERAFRAGQVDITMTVPRTKLAAYAAERPAELHRAPLAETRFLAFNTTRRPLDDLRVRRALGLAIDRAKIVGRITLGGQDPAFRFIAPVLRPAAASAHLATEFRFDPTEARRLLAEAEFPDGRGFPRLELTAWSPSQTPVLEAVQAMWREHLGIEIAVAIREARVHLAALRDATYDIAFATTLLDFADPAAALGDFQSAAADNFPHWHSPEFDRLLAQATQVFEPVARWRLLEQAEAQMLAAGPVAPVYFNTHNWLMSERVQGWRPDPLWTRNYLDVSLRAK
jgi:oligopeptide transport system substrate-binding protein